MREMIFTPIECAILERQLRIEEDIQSLAAKGLSAAMIASMLSLPLTTVQSVMAKEPPRAEQSELSPVEILARTIYAEARGESREGKHAVASVIFNRSQGLPNRMVQVVLKPKQFSCWNSGTAPAGRPGDPSWEESKELAKALLSGRFQPSVSQKYYFNPRISNPSWAYFDKAKTDPRPFVTIGNHRFVSIKEDREVFV